MKTILAIETSTVHGSVVLVREAEVFFEADFHADRAHNSLIFEPLRIALLAGTPELIAVGTGPGSSSGVRVGLAAAVGLGMALALPVVGVASLTAFEAPERCQVVGDARRGLVFVAEISNGRMVGEPMLVRTSELAAELSGSVFTFDAVAPLAGARRVVPSARWLAQRAAALTEAEIAVLAGATPEPIYLHEAFVTTPRPRPRGFEKSS